MIEGERATIDVALQQVTAVFEANREALVRHVERRSRTVDAEDIVQEAFGRLVGEVLRSRSPERPAAWLYRVAGNLIVSEWRHADAAGRRIPHPPQLDEAPDDLAMRHEASLRLRHALDRLAPDARVAVTMAAYGHSVPEIAAEIGRSSLATRALLYRTRARLREDLVELAPH